jgi:hypothetical protein
MKIVPIFINSRLPGNLFEYSWRPEKSPWSLNILKPFQCTSQTNSGKIKGGKVLIYFEQNYVVAVGYRGSSAIK